MIPIHGKFVLENEISVFEDLINFIVDLVEDYLQWIVIALGFIVLYFVLTRVLLRGTIYRTARKEPMCVLTMSGRERSLEYLEKFGGIRGIEAQVIRYLRKHGSVPRKQLENTFGVDAIRKLLEDEFIKIV